MESIAFPVLPLVTDLATRSGLVNADRHRPAFWPKHPFLDYLRIGMRPIQGFGRRGKTSRHNYVGIAFGLQSQSTHCAFPFLWGSCRPELDPAVHSSFPAPFAALPSIDRSLQCHPSLTGGGVWCHRFDER